MDINLLHGDCLELMKDIPDESVDMILTDPPYGIDLKPQRASSNWKNTKVINDDNLDWFGLGNNFRPNYELIILATKGKYKTKSNNLSNILKFRRVAPAKLHHSCEKPVALLELLIEESTEEKSIVIDPFMGSGSTGVACKNLNRNFIGMELDDKYFEIAKRRISEA